MIVDIHGHYTTAPQALWDWRTKQSSGGRPLPLKISDDQIRDMAPQRFRATQYRAVRAQDYERAAMTLPWVQRAGTQFRIEKTVRGPRTVTSVEQKPGVERPAPPFTTSTLQQEASRKLYFSASQTMRNAQRLYEGVEIGGDTVGLITYMRTDGTTLSEDAVTQCRSVIQSKYGDKYLPDAPRPRQ